MIKIQELTGVPSLQYHINEGLTLYDNVYRYSSTSFIQLFKEAREQWRDNKIQLNEEDLYLIEHTDIGEYGDYNGERVPLDLPMVYEEPSDENLLKGMDIIKQVLSKEGGAAGLEPLVKALLPLGFTEDEIVDLLDRMVSVKQHRDGDYIVLPLEEDYDPDQEQLDDEDEIFMPFDDEGRPLGEAEYRGRDVDLNKPKRSSGPKKFYVYVKNDKGNVVKVNFGDSGNLSVKIDEPGARASFAARHKCAQKKDKTTPGYWSCNIGRYWKSLGGKRNFSGYW